MPNERAILPAMRTLGAVVPSLPRTGVGGYGGTRGPGCGGGGAVLAGSVGTAPWDAETGGLAMMAIAENQAVLRILEALNCGRERCVCMRPVASGRGLTHCPAHGDSNPSLSVGCPDRTAWPLLHCFAGCSHKEVAKALRDRGLLPRETAFVVGSGRHVRYDAPTGPKRFRWEGGASPKSHLYRVDALDRLPDQTTVLCCEGETAAEAAIALGLPAVATVTGAATAPNPEAFQPLSRFDVVMVPDAHALGMKHMNQCAEAASRVGVRVRMLMLPDVPEGGDLADWRGTSEGLRELVAAAPEWVPTQNSTLLPVLRRPITFTAAQLECMELPEPRHAVQGLLSEGLGLLAGKPKAGKSWLALNLAVAVASGGKALRTIEVDRGEVLYAALEDSPRRLKGRLAKVLQGASAPPGLTFATDWARFDDGGAEQLDDWLNRHPDARLVILDTLAKVRPARARNGNSYDEDYAHLGAIKAVADAHKVCVLVIHHLRKMFSDDPLDLISGTLAIAGAADSILILQRTGAAPGIDAELHVRGRDMEDADLALRFRSDCATWEVAGTWEDATATGHKRAIRLALADGALSLRDLAAETNIEYRTLEKTMRRLVRNGELQRAQRGVYSLKEPVRIDRDELRNSDTCVSGPDSPAGYRPHSDVSDGA